MEEIGRMEAGSLSKRSWWEMVMIHSRMVVMVVARSGKTVDVFEGSAKEDLLVGSGV